MSKGEHESAASVNVAVPFPPQKCMKVQAHVTSRTRNQRFAVASAGGSNCLAHGPRLFTVAVVALVLNTCIVRAIHAPDDAAQCAPTKVELACNPLAEIVSSDTGSRAKGEYKYCVPRVCVDLPVVEHGAIIGDPDTKEYRVGDEIEIRCDAGFEIAAGFTARSKCTKNCVFDTPPMICVPKKCKESWQDLKGIATFGYVASKEREDANLDVGFGSVDLTVMQSRKPSSLEYNEYVHITCNHGYMASDSSHSTNEPCKVTYRRECRQDGTLSDPGIKCVELKCRDIGDLKPPSAVSYDAEVKTGKYYNNLTNVPAEGDAVYKQRIDLKCEPGFHLSEGLSPSRECSWTCQFTKPKAYCMPFTCDTNMTSVSGLVENVSGWVGAEPNLTGYSGVLQCIDAYVVDVSTCAYNQTIGCIANGLSSNLEEMQSCVPAQCDASKLVVPNSDPKSRGKAGDLYFRSEQSPVVCNAGFRAVTEDANYTGLVLCTDDQSFNATCGVGALGDPGYAPCDWNKPSVCKPVMCEVKPLENGENNLDEDYDILEVANVSYMEYGATLTKTCNPGYRLTTNQSLQYFAHISHATTSTFKCDEFCNSTQRFCKPIACGSYVVPSNSMAMLDSVTYESGNTITHVTFGKDVSVSCSDGFIFSSAGETFSSQCMPQFTVQCRDDGTLSNAGGRCVPAVCSVASLTQQFGPDTAQITPANGTVGGGVANIKCKQNYRWRPESYTGNYALCHHNTSFVAECDAGTCGFPNVTADMECSLMGCYAFEAYNTTDDLYAVQFKYKVYNTTLERTVTSLEDGDIRLDQSLTIVCPRGYRIMNDACDTEPAKPMQAKTASQSNCGQSPPVLSCPPKKALSGAQTTTTSSASTTPPPNAVDPCTLNYFARVNCSRLTCGNFSMPATPPPNCTLQRGGALAVAGNDILDSILYEEPLVVICDTNYRVHVKGMTVACEVRNFTVNCGDDGNFSYTLPDGSGTNGVRPQCVPIVCNMSSLTGARNARYPARDLPAGAAAVNVTCNSGFKAVNGTPAPPPFSTCDDDDSFAVTCEEATCGFAFDEGGEKWCTPLRCRGLGEENLKTVDGLRNLTFTLLSNPAQLIDMGQNESQSQSQMQAGDMSVGLHVMCPDGYFVLNDTTRNAGIPYPESLRKSVTIRCPVDTCELPTVSCERLCSVNQVKTGDHGLVDPSKGLLPQSTSANVTCITGEEGEISPYLVTYTSSLKKPWPVCGSDDSYQVQGCDFPETQPQPQCVLRGCLGTPLNRTEDGLADIKYFKTKGQKDTQIENITDGEYQIDEAIYYECPQGYRVPTTDVCTTVRSCIDTATFRKLQNIRYYIDNGAISDKMHPPIAAATAQCQKDVGLGCDCTLSCTSVTAVYTPSSPLRVEALREEGSTVFHTQITTTERQGATKFADQTGTLSKCLTSSCGMSQVVCRRLGCGNYTIPPNSTGILSGHNGVSVTDLQGKVELQWNDTLTVSCVNGQILDFSDPKSCDFSYSVTCTDEIGKNGWGLLVSNMPVDMDTLKCKTPLKRIYCSNGYKTWTGKNATNGGEKFPDAPAELDCNVGHCDPPNGDESFDVLRDEESTERCQMAQDCTDIPDEQCPAGTQTCLRVLCRPLIMDDLPENIDHIDLIAYNASANTSNMPAPSPNNSTNSTEGDNAGVHYTADEATGYYTKTYANDMIRVYCAHGFVPEKRVYVDRDCTLNYFDMTCDGTGRWSGFQKCVPRLCVVDDLIYDQGSESPRATSWLLYDGETLETVADIDVVKSCPVGQRAQYDTPQLPTCNGKQCIMTAVVECQPWQCAEYVPFSGDHVVYNHTLTNPTEINTNIYIYLSNTTVTCNDGYAAAAYPSSWPPLGGCSKTFYPVCQSDRHFSRQEGQQCFRETCPSYDKVAPDIIFKTSLTQQTQRTGAIIRVKCKNVYWPAPELPSGYGYGFDNADWFAMVANMYETANEPEACNETEVSPYDYSTYKEYLSLLDVQGLYDYLLGFTLLPSPGTDLLPPFEDLDTDKSGCLSVEEARYTVRGKEETQTVTCEGLCKWSAIVQCVQMPCRCMSFDEWKFDLPLQDNPYPILEPNETDFAMRPGDSKNLVCPQGYEFEDRSEFATLTCENDCNLRQSKRVCVPQKCKWSDFDFDVNYDKDFAKQGVKVVPGKNAVINIGQKVTLECAEGFELSDSKPVARVLEGLEEMGRVEVLSEMVFPVPDSLKPVSFSLEGAMQNIKLDIPAGAWPAGLGVGPTLTVFKIPENKKIEGAKVGGPAIFFSPTGIIFSKPVEISLPIDLCTPLDPTRMLRPRKYNKSTDTWMDVPMPEGYQVPNFTSSSEDITNGTNGTNGSNGSNFTKKRTKCEDLPSPVIKGATMSFSAYAAFAVNVQTIQKLTQTATPPPPPPPPKALSEGPLLAYLGILLLLLIPTWYLCWLWQKKAKKGPDEDAKIEDDEHGKTNIRDAITSPIFPSNSAQAVSARMLSNRSIPSENADPLPPLPPLTTSSGQTVLPIRMSLVEAPTIPQRASPSSYGSNPPLHSLSPQSQSRLSDLSPRALRGATTTAAVLHSLPPAVHSPPPSGGVARSSDMDSPTPQAIHITGATIPLDAARRTPTTITIGGANGQYQTFSSIGEA